MGLPGRGFGTMKGEPERHNERSETLLMLGALVFVWHLAVAGSVAWTSGHVPESLRADVHAALRKQGMRSVHVAVQQQEVHLSGHVGTEAERQRAIAVTAMVHGTHLVHASSLGIESPREPAPPPASVGPTPEESHAIDRIHDILFSSVRFEPGVPSWSPAHVRAWTR